MAFAAKLWFLLVLTLFHLTRKNFVDAGPLCQQVPCYFVFGDSLADNGNNNNLKTQAKVNYLPYGVDFPGGPTGRFTNGRNFADIIGNNQNNIFYMMFYVVSTNIFYCLAEQINQYFTGEFLGIKDYLPPFAASQGKNILNGVNYASGGCGILPETGRNQVT